MLVVQAMDVDKNNPSVRDTFYLNTDLSSTKDGNSKRKSFFSQPQGTLEYRVMARDTLDSIALSFDTSPSLLMRLNHRTSRMIFPGQVLYVPDPDAEVPLSPVLHSPTSPTVMDADQPPKTVDVPTVAMKPRDVPTVSQAPSSSKKGRTGTGRSFSLRRSFTRDHSDQKSRPPLQKAQSMPQPGHAVRQKSVEWDSEDSRQYLKLDVKYITDGEGVVSGTMLVTPNAIMFDPNVSDPLVKDRGAGPYGVMTNMDMVLGASMYHDISAMNLKTESSSDKEKPCCPVYVPDKGSGPEGINNSSQEGKNGIFLAQDIRKRLTGCSNYSPEKRNDNHSKDTSQEAPVDEQSADKSERTEDGEKGNGAELDNVTKLKTVNMEDCQKPKESENVVDDDAQDEGFVGDSQCDIQREQSDNKEVICPTSMGYERLQSPSESDQGMKRFSDHAAEDELSTKAAKRTDNGSEDESGDTVEGMEGKEGAEEVGISRMESQDSEKSLEPVDKEMDERLQEIEMLLNSSDDKIEEPAASPAETPDRANDSKSEQKACEKGSSDTDHRTSVDDECPAKCKDPDNSQDTKEQVEDKQNFVDFSSGLFVTDCRKCSLVPDLKECIHVKDEEVLKEIKEEGELIRQLSDDKSPDEDKQEVKVNGESNNNTPGAEDAPDGGIGEKSAGIPVNKPPTRELEYNRTNFREFLPKRAQAYEDPPLYLCLRTKKPMQKTFSARQEHRFKKNKVPEYWFAIPRVKADNLYAFFLQWSPDVYGKEVSPSELGFVVVQESNEDEEIELIEDFFKEPIHKDWEIISREEASKRRMTILECEMNLPLPELVGESNLLSNDHVRKLSKNLPPRTEGYSWFLIFSTASHGYSLHSLYRNMANWESPILLILRDSEGHVFGALTSCALKVSDHYYGTGESFLYKFKDEELELYKWTGENNFFMKGDLDCVCIGGGEGDFGLWLDGDLYHGRSHPTKTFANEILSSKEDFIIADMEAWGFNM
nr:nuclear receptor coactivator 7-like [Lytechinus pictus]